MTNQTQLRRIRWIVRLTLALGVAASVAANVLHARDNLISQTIAAWPPLALLLAVELISRVPVHRRGLALLRVGATTIIAAIAAWVSYWHMAGVTARYGESPASAHLMPISVDGLIVVASISLVELAGRIRALDTATAPTSPARARRPATAAPRHDDTSGRGNTQAAATKPARARKTTPSGKNTTTGRAATTGRPTTTTTPAGQAPAPGTHDGRPTPAPAAADTPATDAPANDRAMAATTSA